MKIRNWIYAIALSAYQHAFCLHFVAYGDARTNPDTHQTVVDAIAKVNPELILFSGDLWDGYGPDKFKSILTKNANIADLLNKNLFLVSRGNHEAAKDLLAFQPSLVRGGKELYSFSQGDCFFVSLAMDPAVATAYLEQQLQTPEAKQAAWKFVYSHYPVYSTGTHGSHGIPAVEALCDKYGVNMVINGHDHIYERSQQMYAGKVADSGNTLVAEKGTVYIVTGGGGAPLYPVGTAPFSHFAKSTNNFTDIVVDAKRISVRALSPNGSVIDAFTLTKGGTTGLETQTAQPTVSSLKVHFIAGERLAIVSFGSVQGPGGLVEIHSPDGSLLSRSALAPGQSSISWDYAHAAPGKYLAVLKEGEHKSAASFSLQP